MVRLRSVEQTLPQLHLRLLGNGMPALTPARGLMMAESAAVCFEDRLHSTGVLLKVVGISDTSFSVEWDGVTDVQRNCYNDFDEATEHGAYGIAILLVREITGKK